MLLTLVPIPIALVALLVSVAVCSSLETAVFSLSYHDRVRLRKQSPGADAAVGIMLSRPRTFLVTLLFINTLGATLYFVLTAILSAQFDRLWLELLLAGVNLLAMTLAAEVISKIIAGRYRVEVLRLLAPLCLPVYLAVRPLGSVLDAGVIAPLTRLFVPRAGDGAPGVQPEELRELLSLGASQGVIDSDEQRVLRQVLQFGLVRVREAMIPRVELEWIEENARPEEIREIVRRTRLTRLPVCRGGIDNEVLGLLDSKGYLAALARGGVPRPGSYLEPPVYTPQNASLDKLLEFMRVRALKQAIVVDEYGSVVGLIATADLARRLMSELADVGAEGDKSEQIRLIAPGRWAVPGRLSVRQWADMFEIELGERVSTVGGLVFARLGRLPRVGDTITLGNVRLEVTELDGRSVAEVAVSLVAPEPAPAPGGGEP